MVTDDIYLSYMTECYSTISGYVDKVVSGELTKDEAKSELLAQNEYGAYDYDIFNCEWWMTSEQLSYIEANHNPGLVAFGISDEELIDAFCSNIAPTCEEQIDGVFSGLAAAEEETATEARTISSMEIAKTAAIAKTSISI